MSGCKWCRSMWGDGATKGDCGAVTCLGCSSEVCFSAGLGRGTCCACRYGILPGWGGADCECSYKGCGRRALFKYVPGAKKRVCREHAAQATLRLAGRRVTLEEYVRERVNRKPDGWENRIRRLGPVQEAK